MQIRKEGRVEPPLETAKYDIRIQICAQKFLGALDIDINGSRHTCTSLCTWIECSTSLERNHYITSKQRKVAVFSSTFAWEYGSIGVIPRLYSICLYTLYRYSYPRYCASSKYQCQLSHSIESIKVSSFCHEQKGEIFVI